LRREGKRQDFKPALEGGPALQLKWVLIELTEFFFIVVMPLLTALPSTRALGLDSARDDAKTTETPDRFVVSVSAGAGGGSVGMMAIGSLMCQY
jgi:hypothetical protein